MNLTKIKRVLLISNSTLYGSRYLDHFDDSGHTSGVLSTGYYFVRFIPLL